jgi:hypothetical protein
MLKDKKDVLVNGYSNIFFVESNGEVFALIARRHDDSNGDGWHVYVRRFGNGRTWNAGFRFFSRNLGTRKLVPLESSSVPSVGIRKGVVKIKIRELIEALQELEQAL